MQKKVLLVSAILIGLIILGVVFVLPALDEEMMKAPLADGLMALRNGNSRLLRSYFTPNAMFGNARTSIPVEHALEKLRTSIDNKELDSTMRFDGFTNLRHESATRVSADFTITIYYEGDDSPYRRIPIDKKGHVVLEKQGFLKWEIQRLTSEEPEAELLMQ